MKRKSFLILVAVREKKGIDAVSWTLTIKNWEVEGKMTDWKYLFLQVYNHGIQAFSCSHTGIRFSTLDLYGKKYICVEKF